jgi:hypothetical protein
MCDTRIKISGNGTFKFILQNTFIWKFIQAQKKSKEYFV